MRRRSRSWGSSLSRVMISLQRVTKRFPNAAADALRELSLDIEAGETVVLVRPLGMRQTTTMKMINRLIEPTSGTILVDAKNVLEQDPVAMVPAFAGTWHLLCDRRARFRSRRGGADESF